MEVTACSFGMATGSTMSGTAPLGICWFIESVLRHQWQRACVLSAVLITTSAPHAVHLKVSTSSLEGMMSTAPEPISTPVSPLISALMPSASSADSAHHPYRQKAHRSSPARAFTESSVAPQRAHFTRPSPVRALLSAVVPTASAADSALRSYRHKAHRSSPVRAFREISVAPQRAHFTRPSTAPESVSMMRGPSAGGAGGAPGGAAAWGAAGAGAASAVGAPWWPGWACAPGGGGTGEPLGGGY